MSFTPPYPACKTYTFQQPIYTCPTGSIKKGYDDNVNCFTEFKKRCPLSYHQIDPFTCVSKTGEVLYLKCDTTQELTQQAASAIGTVENIFNGDGYCFFQTPHNHQSCQTTKPWYTSTSSGIQDVCVNSNGKPICK